MKRTQATQNVNRNGFTLLEVMFTVLIILIALLSIFLTLVYCAYLNQSNSNLVVAVNDAQAVLEQIKNLDYADICSYVVPVFNNLNNENITVQYSAVCVGTEINEVTVDVSWVDRQRPRNFQLSTRIAR